MFLVLTASAAWSEPIVTPDSNDEETVEALLDNAYAEPQDQPEENVATEGVEVEITMLNGVTLRGKMPLNQVVLWNPSSTQAIQFNMGQQTIELQSNQIVSMKQVLQTPSVPVEVEVQAQTSEPSELKVESENEGVQEPVLNENGFSFANPAASRYLYAPSSIGLQAGQGYVSQKLLFTSGVYALTDNATILVGTLVPIPAISVLGAKVSKSIRSDLHLSAGVESFFLPFSGINGDGGIRVPFTIGFAGVTKGDLDSHITVSTGVIYEDIVSNGNFVHPIMVAGHHRVSDRLALVSENWLILNTDMIQDGRSPYMATVSSFAFRLVGQRDSNMQIFGQLISDTGYPRYTWDIGLIVVHGASSESLRDPITGETYYSKYTANYGFGPFPWIDYTWHFGPARKIKTEEE